MWGEFGGRGCLLEEKNEKVKVEGKLIWLEHGGEEKEESNEGEGNKAQKRILLN